MKRLTRILWNRRPTGAHEGGDIDELVIEGKVHVEQMHERCWWIAVYRDDDTYWMGNFSADSRGRMRFSEQENHGIDWDDDRTHEAKAS